MGFAVTARCKDCDYSHKLRLGAGRDTYRTRADWPVWCDNCGKLDTTNFMERPLRCSHCNSSEVTRPNARKNTRQKLPKTMTWSCTVAPKSEIHQPRRRGFFGLLEWLRLSVQRFRRSEELGLHDGDYRCPDCQAFALRFRVFMRFD